MAVIKTPDQRIRVFISSTLQELAEERKIIHEAVTRLRLIPVMFELGARPHPPRDLYCAYLEQSQVFIGIYWKSYGWVAPGMSISGLEDEYRLSKGKPRLIYVRQSDEGRQPELDRLLKEIQNSDLSYKKFSTLDELKEFVENDLALLLSERFEEGFSEQQPMRPSPRTRAIPTPRTPLVGREKECGEITGILPSTGHVTITGPGGTGKSRLALEIAHKLKEVYPDGVFFIPLESVQDPKSVIAAIAHEIGLYDNGRLEVYDLLAKYLSDKNSLLLLDNFEHVVTAATELSKLQQECPGLHMLVTSRTPLRISGEQVYQLEPLSHPDFVTIHSAEQLKAYPAVELFMQRSQALSPGNVYGEDNIKAIAEICRRLDGLPLAIELAASHTKYLPPTTLAQRMDHVLDFLTRSPQDFPNRQRTMRSTISWSSELLDEQSRRFFFKLGCFQGSWTLEAADEIAHEDPMGLSGILEHVEKLIDFGLVKPVGIAQAGEEPRFILLQTIREFALESLKAMDLLEPVAERHANYFCRLVQEAEPYFWTPLSQVWIDRLEKDLPEFREAFHWALQNNDVEKQWILTGCLAQVFTSKGMGTEASQWISASNLRSEEGKSLSPELRGRTFYYAGVQQFFSGQLNESWDNLQEAVTIYRQSGDMVSLARSLTFLGLTGITLRNENALKIFYEAIETGNSINDSYSVILATTFLAETLAMLGHVESAAPMITKAEELARQSGNQMLLAALLITKGNYGITIDNRDISVPSYSECIELHQFFSQMTLEGWGRLGLVYWDLLDRNVKVAAEKIDIILDLGKKSGDLALQIGCLISIAGFMGLADNMKVAARILGTTDKMCIDSGYNLWTATLKLKTWVESMLKEKLPADEYLSEYNAGMSCKAETVIEEYRRQKAILASSWSK
jgi:predicted ATPase